MPVESDASSPVILLVIFEPEVIVFVCFRVDVEFDIELLVVVIVVVVLVAFDGIVLFGGLYFDTLLFVTCNSV